MSTDDPIKDESTEEAPDEDVKELMKSYDLDKDTAERVQELWMISAWMKMMPLKLRRVFNYYEVFTGQT